MFVPTLGEKKKKKLSFSISISSLVPTLFVILRRMHCSTGDSKASSTSHRNQRHGRGSGGGRDGGDDFAGRSMRLNMGWVTGFAVFLTALLPSLVAGQTMTCVSGIYDKYVEPSTETFAKLNGLAGGLATFTSVVRLSPSSAHTLLLFSLF